jgi:transcriptional regulator with XRE-family HTH domain
MFDIAADRKAHDLTQADLAGRLGVDQATVSRWESGKLTPNSRDFIAIRTAIDELAGERRAAA